MARRLWVAEGSRNLDFSRWVPCLPAAGGRRIFGPGDGLRPWSPFAATVARCVSRLTRDPQRAPDRVYPLQLPLKYSQPHDQLPRPRLTHAPAADPAAGRKSPSPIALVARCTAGVEGTSRMSRGARVARRAEILRTPFDSPAHLRRTREVNGARARATDIVARRTVPPRRAS